ncbi:MAG: hypothetical protein QNL04_15590 [SAR324 cluster bacterium]|nr:hypothetical protein [SAR324 cluster bacterium]
MNEQEASPFSGACKKIKSILSKLLVICLIPFFSACSDEVPVYDPIEQPPLESFNFSDINSDSSGNIYITGHTNISLGSAVNLGGNDFFLAQFDSEGTLAWSGSWGTDSEDTSSNIQIDDEGNLLHIGNSYGMLDGVTAKVSRDITIHSFDTLGQLNWYKQFYTDTDDHILNSKLINSEIQIVGAVSGDFRDFTSVGLLDAFLVSYSTSGVLNWSQTLGSIYNDSAHAIALSPNGKTVIAGNASESIKSKTFLGSQDYFVAKFDSLGQFAQHINYGSEYFEGVTDMEINQKGEIFLTGHTTGDLFDTYVSGTDLWIQKLNASGSQNWAKQIASTTVALFLDCIIKDDADLICVGYVEDDFEGLTEIGGADILIARFDTDGNQIWMKRIGTPANDVGRKLHIDGSNNIWIGGSTGGVYSTQEVLVNQSCSFIAKISDLGKVKIWSALGTGCTT